MPIRLSLRIHQIVVGVVSWTALASCDTWARGEPVVPGTGIKLEAISDDFEDTSWSFRPNLPKSSKNLDETVRAPRGVSSNGLWSECSLRGEPDVVERTATPVGGLPGSTGALLIQSRLTGIPGKFTGKLQQDDLQMNVTAHVRGGMPVSWTPSMVVRVYLPPFEQWEARGGSTFAFRADVFGSGRKRSEGFFGMGGSNPTSENYWPGLFIMYNAPNGRAQKGPSAYIVVRGTERGADFRGPEITQLGWWTLGMSFTPDGLVHYYARPGVDPLTAGDHIASRAPYGYRCERVNTMFFDVWSHDDGRTWSTPWVVDDPTHYCLRGAPPAVAHGRRSPSAQKPAQQTQRPSSRRR